MEAIRTLLDTDNSKKTEIPQCDGSIGATVFFENLQSRIP